MVGILPAIRPQGIHTVFYVRSNYCFIQWYNQSIYGNITRERACANTGTLAVLIKRLKKAMCAFAWRNPCDVDFSIRLTEVTPTRVRVTVTVSLTD